MTDKKIVDTIRKWLGDPDIANCVFENEKSINEWLDRAMWFNKAYQPAVINAEYVILYDNNGKPLSDEPMIYNKETMMIYRVVCKMEFLEKTNCWQMKRCTSDGKTEL